jgi:hypothetical protein
VAEWKKAAGVCKTPGCQSKPTMNTDTRLIPLPQGKFAIVDACDYEWLSRWNWWLLKFPMSYGHLFYAARSAGGRLNKHTILMHREVARRAGLPESKEYDHIDRNGLNDSRSNLRPASRTQTRANSTKSKGKSSQYKGVYWHKKAGKWMARIGVNRKMRFLGYFTDEVEAARAYDRAALEIYGEFACLNFPRSDYL